MTSRSPTSDSSVSAPSILAKFLDKVEVLGNRLPDPAIIFLYALVLVLLLSALFAQFEISAIDPRSGEALQIHNLLTGERLADFLSRMVSIFANFTPLGVVLVAMLGVGVAEHSGFIHALIRRMMDVTPAKLLTPSIVLIAIVSHTATDAGYVLVIPLAGIVFYAAGRHPLAGIAAAFAGVSGGFSANFIPSAIDPLLQGFTQSAAQLLDPDIKINPLNNWAFTSASCALVIGVAWYITDKIIEPRLKNMKVDDDVSVGLVETLSVREVRAMRIALAVLLFGIAALVAMLLPGDSPFRSDSGQLASYSAPIMRSIVPLIFLLFVIPGCVYGFLSGSFNSSSDVIQAMSKAMSGMSYYIVMAFFCALFIDAFAKSNLGVLLAVKGALFLQALSLPSMVTIVGMIFLTAFVNLFIGSASAKWAMIGPIFVPMLMQLNISPDLTQAAYRLGDSSSNIITPLMPYFPLVVVYCQRYVKNTGVGTLVALMLPYAVTILVSWTLFLLCYWGMGLPLGIQAAYEYFPN
ncbi:MAG: AbgT family transporter [Agarilytica sp.]